MCVLVKQPMEIDQYKCLGRCQTQSKDNRRKRVFRIPENCTLIQNDSGFSMAQFQPLSSFDIHFSIKSYIFLIHFRKVFDFLSNWSKLVCDAFIYNVFM